MHYAKVVLGLPAEGPFDYIIPEQTLPKIKPGCRVSVSFGRSRKLGYVTGLSGKTDIKNVKPILRLVDETPVLDKNMLALTKEISDYYCCSWGEAIELALPQALRRPKSSGLLAPMPVADTQDEAETKIELAHSPDVNEKWKRYIAAIKEALNRNKSVIILLTDIPAVIKAQDIINLNIECTLAALHRNQPDELAKWLEIKQGRVNIVAGTRSGVFAPVGNLGLIIVDEEQAYGHKQDQSPHYHAREVAFMRAKIDKADLLLGSSAPSLESVNLSRHQKIKYNFISPVKSLPEISICDMKGLPLVSHRKNVIFSKYLADSIFQTLNPPVKGKVLLFLDRLGFATVAHCFGCNKVLKCPRCNINLVFHYKENILRCHYCNFTMAPPKLCPDCNSGYIRYSGAGTEKLESELSRLFPQARVKQLNISTDFNMDDADIFVATQAVIKETALNFDLIGVLGIDKSLNHVDFRAGEKAFQVLSGLAGLTGKKMIIQTSIGSHFVFKALNEKNPGLFYNEELKQRRELDFPPLKHFALIKLRGKIEERAESMGKALFEKLNDLSDKTLEFVSFNPSYPAKLRGNFCRQILVRSSSAQRISRFLKTHLKNFPHSGIIITVDMDPL